jgi:hypothetical protein
LRRIRDSEESMSEYCTLLVARRASIEGRTPRFAVAGA